MKKTTKGAVAAGAAAILLAGGAGTYAAWTATSDQVAGGAVQTGHLKVTEKPGTDTGWKWVEGGTPGTAVGATDTLSPGDKIAYTGTYVLGIKGTNLTAKVDVVRTDNQPIPGELTWTSTSSAPLTGLKETTDNGREITAGGVLEFPGTATGTMDTTATIGNFQVVLKQTAPAAVDTP